MKCLKVDDYIQRTNSESQTTLLLQELKNYVRTQPGLQGRTLCDRIIRACNHQLGTGNLDFDHTGQLVKLFELSLHGYDRSTALVAKSSPLYMEKIIFHVVKKLSSLKVFTLCTHVAGLLYSRLAAVQTVEEDFCVLVRSCFSVLWNGASLANDEKVLNLRDRVHCQMQALSFLLLLDSETTIPSQLKALVYTDDVINEFETRCGVVSKEDASFLLQEMRSFFNRYLSPIANCEGEKSKLHKDRPSLYAITAMGLTVVKMLCKASHYNQASAFLSEIESMASDFQCQGTAFVLSKCGVKIHSALKTDNESCSILTECARALRSLSTDVSDGEAHAVLEGCSLVVWAVESGHNKELSGPGLLALFSFLEEHQELLLKIINRKSTCHTEARRLQKALCFSIYQGFVFAYESFLASQLEVVNTLDRVLLYCQSTAGLMMTELRKLSSENLIVKAVIAVSNLACGLYNRRLYDQAFTLVEILCKDLCKNCPPSLSVDRFTRPFMLAVQTSRRAGQLERALDWVIVWLKALGDNIPNHMAEPVSLWVKTKMDAARNSEDDIRLRTLRDGFGADVPDEAVMLGLLEEELLAYKEVLGDTAQERYNTLCDLLDICHAESPRTHLRGIYLCEMAQVVCFQDFSEQTDCMAVDFTHEALRLLEEEPETPENADRLQDDKAHALLWHYICTLEKNLQEAIESDRKRKEVQEMTQSVANPVGNNDFDYEDKQKTQDSIMVYEGLQFNLAAETRLCQPLEKSLDGWSALFQRRSKPSVRNPKQTCSSISVTAALFKLMGKPLKALEAYQLVVGFSQQLCDAQGCARALCQSASLLLDMGVPELALAQLEQSEEVLSSESNTDGLSSLSVMVLLLKAQYYYSVGQIGVGVPYLCQVLKEVNEQRQSKTWYLLRAQTFQTCSSYLNLDTTQLPQSQRSCIAQHGIKNPDTALYESLKLLCSLLVTVVGKGLYGSSNSNTSDVRFIDQGDNLVLKWQLLSELLNCAVKIVAVRRLCGALNDARLQCLEALKLAIKLQALSQCAELLVMKAELELMQGEREESKTDLDKVRHLLELCTVQSDQIQKADVKIKPRKGRPAQKSQSPLPAVEDDLTGLLSTRWIAKEPVVTDLTCSPPLKAQPRRWLSSLAHESDCQCPCCSEPCLGRATARWAATQADLVLQLDSNEASIGFKLHRATLSRCMTVATKVGANLSKIFPSRVPSKGPLTPSLMEDLVGRVYLHMALFGLEPSLNKVYGIWKILRAGLTFVDSTSSPVLRPVKAGLMVTKAIASLMVFAAKKGCAPVELFSNVWMWKVLEEMKEMKQGVKIASSLSKLRKPNDASKVPDVRDKNKETKKVKVVKPKIQVTASLAKEKCLVPRTPVTMKQQSSVKELDCFDFNTLVPTFACTPVRRVRGSASAQKAPRAGAKLHFHVYEELSPVQSKAQLVPAAPQRSKKSRFKVEFSDESDSEASTKAECQKEAVVRKRQTTARRAAMSATMAPGPPTQKVPLTLQKKEKKSTTVPRSVSSEDEERLIHQPLARRGRSRKHLSKMDVDVDEPDKMRAIEEETKDVLNISTEQLRTSDTEQAKDQACLRDANVDLEVLRRELCLERDELSELKSRSSLRGGPQTHISHSNSQPDDVSLEDVQSLLRSAWLILQHHPSPSIYPTLCALLALTTGQRDPRTTAMLHAQSLGITSRHRTIRHLASCSKKLKKASNELTDKMGALTLNVTNAPESSSCTEGRLLQLESIFSFPTVDSSSSPETHHQEFMQQIQHLPPAWGDGRRHHAVTSHKRL
ncbi:separin isoform X2 [Gouania willdenowi]|uniref:separin isoform X2 n=1 Tax=Gouania willdenowi TaxID=441366 RepID=UPI001055F966|nr:separin isoform X2 [Gouania willdenowi]